DDVMTVGGGEARKARDNCVFEAGLFMSAIGRERCFLVNSVSPSDLPSDLGGIISTPFDEPADLTDRSACAKAIAGAAANLKDIIQRMGPRPFHDRVPLLSVDEVFKRERPQSDGGDLVDGRVVVCDTQPWEGGVVSPQHGQRDRLLLLLLLFRRYDREDLPDAANDRLGR